MNPAGNTCSKDCSHEIPFVWGRFVNHFLCSWLASSKQNCILHLLLTLENGTTQSYERWLTHVFPRFETRKCRLWNIFARNNGNTSDFRQIRGKHSDCKSSLISNFLTQCYRNMINWHWELTIPVWSDGNSKVQQSESMWGKFIVCVSRSRA